MLNVDNFINKLVVILDFYGIPRLLFGFILLSIITTFYIFKLKKIDKNENIFKIMFSEKYNDEFGGEIIGKFNKRHQFIIEFFCLVLTYLIAIILFIGFIY